MKRIIPHIILVTLVMWSCSGSKYVTNTNFYQLEKGMSEKAFLEWIKPNYAAENGRPVNVKMFNYRGEEWKVYVFNIYRVDPYNAYFSHKEYVAFVGGRLVEYGTGELPLTIRQNPNEFVIKNR